MLNLLNKTTSWMVASLLAATSAVIAQDTTRNRPQKSYEQGHEVEKNQLMPAYNAPASISVRGSWDVYVTGSFLYWQAREDNLEIGILSNGLPTSPVGGPFLPNPLNYTAATFVNSATSGNVVNSSFSYGPGFKLGIGMNLDYDGWDAYAEYTWFHKRSYTNVDLSSDCDCEPASNDWLFPTRMMSAGITSGDDSNHGYKFANQYWNVKLDFLDLSLARSYYCGTKLSFRPFFGARGAWIRQSTSVDFSGQAVATTVGGVTTIAEDTTDTYYQTQSGNIRSWGVGPRAGFESNWMLGCGFRLIGDVSADVLYTRYDVKSKAALSTQYAAITTPAAIAAGAGTTAAALKQKHIDMLRPHVDMELGFGWGSYFDNSNWHFDLLATYGYQVFWNQNMFRNFSDSQTGRSTNANGNLYVHGLTLTARFDF